MKNTKDTAIRKKARAVLKEYRRLKRMASSRSFASKDQMNLISSEEQLKKIDAALANLCSLYKQILYLSYCDIETHSNYQIGCLIGGYSDKSVERFKAIALIEFAEAYSGGCLLSTTEAAGS